jgi:adenylosuccinate synthase
MARKIVLLSGPVSAGKSTLGDRLHERYGAHHFHTQELLRDRAIGSATLSRRELQVRGQRLDVETHGQWVMQDLAPRIASLPDDALVVVDSLRISEQIDAFRTVFNRSVIHVHLTAPEAELASRYERRQRRRPGSELQTYGEVRRNRTEAAIESLAADADIVIDTGQNTPGDVEIRTARYLRLTGEVADAYVDVIVGGQYGSEGKGNVAFHLAPEYDLLIRVCGPNAGHKVPLDEPYTHRSLPSGTLADDAPRLLIGPGAVVNIDVLLREIAECHVDVERLAIDPQVMVISAADIRAERNLVREIGSTGQGVGEATARRIRARSKGALLAKDVSQLRPYITRACDVLASLYQRRGKALLEGTQGTALSLYHGSYPHVTSRDTTVAGCLAEAGVPPKRVRKIVMVCRTYPIRVQSPAGKTSGPMSQPITWKLISKRSGLPLRELTETERGSVSHKQRRVAEFDWRLLHDAALLNGPTDIALTFVDYLDFHNRDARRFDQLVPETIRFIEEVERIAAAPVSLISTRFHVRSVIDRRAW